MLDSGTIIVIIFIVALIIVLGFFIKSEREGQKISKAIGQEKVQEVKSRAEIMRELESVIQKIIREDFTLTNCSKCDDGNFELLRFNNAFTAIEWQCETCNKKNWIKRDSNAKNTARELSNKISELERLAYSGESLVIRTVASDLYKENTQESEEKNVQREPIPRDVQDRVWNRDGGKCVRCGSNEKLEFDHIIPHSKGGANTYRNIQLLCEKCNRSKSDKIG